MNDIAHSRKCAPVLPVVTWRSLILAIQPWRHDDLGRTDAIGFPSGTAALAGALSHAGIGRDDEVLVPGFNCPSMLEPARGLGAHNRIVRIREDLSIDLTDAAARLTPQCRALIVPHYFGIRQDRAAIRAFCRQHRLTMIEDRAHCWFDDPSAGPTRPYGDYEIFSLRKFFPCGDGGLLRARIGLDAPQPRTAGIRAELKTLLNSLEESAAAGRLTPVNWLITALATAATRLTGARRRTEGDTLDDGGSTFRYYDPDAEHTDMARVTRWFMLRADGRAIRTARTENYRYLARALGEVGGCRVLYPELPPGTVPYMLPLIVEAGADSYFEMRRTGTPLFRWDDSVTGDCSVSRYFATHLLQVPCHECLRSDDLNRMTATIAAAITGDERESAGRLR